MLVIGLCGASGSGKTTACAYLAQKGYTVLDCDKIYDDLLYPGSPCLAAIQKEFGSVVINSQGTLDRRRLAQIVFSCDQRRQALNRITFFFIKEEIQKRLQTVKDVSAKVILDAPLLFESGLNEICDLTVGILAPDAVKVQRLILRDKRTPQELFDRIGCQKSNAELTELCDRTVVNDGDLVSFYKKLDLILQ